MIKTELDRRFELGNQFIIGAVGASIESIIPAHRELVAEGYAVPKRHKHPRTAVGKFFAKQYFADYHLEVTERLRNPRPV